MVYHVPQPYRCDKCGHEQEYSQDAGWSAPRIWKDGRHSDPVCPVCWAKFVKANCGLMTLIGQPEQ